MILFALLFASLLMTVSSRPEYEDPGFQEFLLAYLETVETQNDAVAALNEQINRAESNPEAFEAMGTSPVLQEKHMDPAFLQFLEVYVAKRGQVTIADLPPAAIPTQSESHAQATPREAPSPQVQAHSGQSEASTSVAAASRGSQQAASYRAGASVSASSGQGQQAESLESELVHDLVHEAEEKVKDSVREYAEQIGAGASRAAKKFAQENILNGPGGKVFLGNSKLVQQFDDVRVLNDPVFAKAMASWTQKNNQLGAEMVREISAYNRYRSQAEALEGAMKAGDTAAAAQFEKLKAKAIQHYNLGMAKKAEVAALKKPTPPEILTSWDKFKKTKLGEKVSKPLDAAAAKWDKFRNSDFGKKWIKNPVAGAKPPPPPQNKAWDNLVSRVEKLVSPKAHTVTKVLPNGLTEMSTTLSHTRLSRLYEQARGLKHQVNVARMSFWQGYSVNGNVANMLVDGNKLAFKLGRAAWAGGLSQPVVHAAKAVKQGIQIAKSSAKAVLGKLGPVGMVASGAHAVVEATRDLTLLREQASRGEELDPQLIKNVIFAFTGADVILGRGGTEMIGGLVIKGARGMVKHLVGCMNLKRADECAQRTVEGLKNAVNTVKNAAKKVHAWTKDKLQKAHNATKTCFREKGHMCVVHGLHATGKGIVKGAKWIGKTVGGWAMKHWNHHMDKRAKSKERDALCAVSEEAQAKCDAEDAERAANRSFAWKSLGSQAVKSLKSAPGKAWGSIKSWFSGDDEGEGEPTQEAQEE